jgi:hypothetical protein
LKNIEIPHVAKVTREERERLLDFGLDGVFFSVPSAIDRQGGTP